MWNVATDLAINSHISDMLPDGGCIPERVGTPFEKYPSGLLAEAYFDMLKNDEQFKPKDEDGEGQGQGQGQGGGQPSQGQGQGGLGDYQMDDHSGWGDVEYA